MTTSGLTNFSCNVWRHLGSKSSVQFKSFLSGSNVEALAAAGREKESTMSSRNMWLSGGRAFRSALCFACVSLLTGCSEYRRAAPSQQVEPSTGTAESTMQDRSQLPAEETPAAE
jgi:hypothetical protein